VCPQCRAVLDNVEALISHVEAFHPSGDLGPTRVRHYISGWLTQTHRMFLRPVLSLARMVTLATEVHTALFRQAQVRSSPRGGGGSSSGGGGGREVCPHCSAPFTSVEDLIQHVEVFHSDSSAVSSLYPVHRSHFQGGGGGGGGASASSSAGRAGSATAGGTFLLGALHCPISDSPFMSSASATKILMHPSAALSLAPMSLLYIVLVCARCLRRVFAQHTYARMSVTPHASHSASMRVLCVRPRFCVPSGGSEKCPHCNVRFPDVASLITHVERRHASGATGGPGGSGGVDSGDGSGPPGVTKQGSCSLS
jgi:uncharacterized C2H2 Zn-finger protein